jgi:hypothetical protein
LDDNKLNSNILENLNKNFNNGNNNDNYFNSNKKLNNLFTIIKLSSDKDDLINLEEMIKENVFESIQQIRINPFTLKQPKYKNNNNNDTVNKNLKKNNSKKLLINPNSSSNKIPKSPDVKSSYYYLKKNASNIINNNNINNNNDNFKMQSPRNVQSSIKITKTNPTLFNKNNNHNNSKDTTKNTSLNSSLNMSNNFLLKNKQRNSLINSTNNNNSNNFPTQTGHKLLKKTIKFLYFKILFPFCLSFFIILDIYQILKTKSSKKKTENILNKEFDLFNTVFLLISSVQIHIFSLLSNKDPNLNYINKGYLEFCGNNNEINKNKNINYNVFEHILICYTEIQSRFENIVNGDFDEHFTYMKQFFSDLFTDDFCKVFTQMLKNSQKKEVFFSNTISQEVDYLEIFCQEIGNFTSKGLITIVQSVHTEIVNLHNDFIKNENSNKNIKELINNKFLLLLERVCFMVLGKLATTFGFVFFEDFNSFNFSIQKNLILFVFIQFVMVNILTIYFIMEVSKYIKEEKNIIEFGERLGNTILY